MDFVAIDFETANSRRESACAIGLTYVENMVIVDQEYFLIRPTPFYFDAINQSVHGISEREVESAPTFDQVWTKISSRIHNKQLIAHNASFDFSVLRYVLNAYGIPFPDIKYGCTLQLFRKLALPLENNKLSTLAKYYNLSLDHHNALSDSVVCAQIAIQLMKELACPSLDNLADKFGYQLGSISQTAVTPFTKTKRSSSLGGMAKTPFESRTNAYLQKKSEFLSLRTELFHGKKIILSGTFSQMDRGDLGIVIEENGGKLQTSVSSRTDFIIYGKNMGPCKKEKALRLKTPMISEQELLKMIYG